MSGERCFDLGDFPLLIDARALERLTTLIRELAPDVIITHTERDPFNPDHPVVSAAVQHASILASGSGVASGFPTIKPAELFLFEPPSAGTLRLRSNRFCRYQHSQPVRRD